jgi:hypothetical protein
VLFEKRLREGIHAGRVTVTFRRWRRLQVKVGGRYRTGADGGRGQYMTGSGLIEVTAVDEVSPADITDADARDAGFDSTEELLTDVARRPDLALYRIRFKLLDEPDPRAELAADTDLSDADVAELDRRLDLLDASSATGPWTAATLALIADQPGVVSTVLAEALARERLSFKQDVSRLKRLGLTISLPVGYRLSPRGAAYRRRTRR